MVCRDLGSGVSRDPCLGEGSGCGSGLDLGEHPHDSHAGSWPLAGAATAPRHCVAVSLWDWLGPEGGGVACMLRAPEWTAWPERRGEGGGLWGGGIPWCHSPDLGVVGGGGGLLIFWKGRAGVLVPPPSSLQLSPRLAPSPLSFLLLCLSGMGDCSQAGSAEVFGETTLTPLFWFLL